MCFVLASWCAGKGEHWYAAKRLPSRFLCSKKMRNKTRLYLAEAVHHAYKRYWIKVKYSCIHKILLVNGLPTYYVFFSPFFAMVNV